MNNQVTILKNQLAVAKLALEKIKIPNSLNISETKLLATFSLVSIEQMGNNVHIRGVQKL